ERSLCQSISPCQRETSTPCTGRCLGERLPKLIGLASRKRCSWITPLRTALTAGGFGRGATTAARAGGTGCSVSTNAAGCGAITGPSAAMSTGSSTATCAAASVFIAAAGRGMELVVSSEGRGTRSSKPPLEVQPVATRQKTNDARMPEERIPTLYAKPNMPAATCRRRNPHGYEGSIAKKD